MLQIKEQFVICLRWVNDKFGVHEEFIGLYEIDNLTANTLVAAIKDTLLHMNLNLSRCRVEQNMVYPLKF